MTLGRKKENVTMQGEYQEPPFDLLCFVLALFGLTPLLDFVSWVASLVGITLPITCES